MCITVVIHWARFDFVKARFVGKNLQPIHLNYMYVLVFVDLHGMTCNKIMFFRCIYMSCMPCDFLHSSLLGFRLEEEKE